MGMATGTSIVAKLVTRAKKEDFHFRPVACASPTFGATKQSVGHQFGELAIRRLFIFHKNKDRGVSGGLAHRLGH